MAGMQDGRHRRAVAMVGAIFALLLAQPATASLSQASPGDLPEPYSAWNVTVVASDEGPGVQTVSYDSPALHRRTVNTVYLPKGYSRQGTRLPVLYYLHGTVLPFIDATALDPLTCREFFLCIVSGGGGNKQVLLQDFSSQRDKARFLVVAPDTDPDKSWCETCWWIDGRKDWIPNAPPLTAETLPAETVLYTEVLPLIEHLYNVRRDRGGRGVIGFSMGGAAAALQAFRHPDRYAYMGAITGIYDIVGDLVVRNGLDGAGYFRDQGYPYLTSGIWWRNFNPRDLASNVVGSGMKLMFSAGDICLPPTDDEGREDCAKYPPLTNPVGAGVEQMLGQNIERSVRQIPEAGLAADQVRFSGIHGANNHRVYAEVIVPQANAVFAGRVATTDTFRYRAVDRRFSIWGYRFSVERSTDEFLEVEDARHDARIFALRGSGSVSVRTPPVFEPLADYRVTLSSASGVVNRRTVRANARGSLSLGVGLDDPAFQVDGPRSGYARIAIKRL